MPDSKTITYIPKQFRKHFPYLQFISMKIKNMIHIMSTNIIFHFHILKHKYYIILTEDII